MIFVVLGTHELPFTRLLQAIDQLIAKGIITEQVIAQIGHTHFNSNQMQLHTFLTYEQMDHLYEQADLIVTHAGTGSVISGLKKGKVVIAVPRLMQFGEHNDDHQLQLIDAFERQGHILACRDTNQLEQVFEQCKQFNPKPFQSGRTRLFSILNQFIQQEMTGINTD
ncbi:UDP-N-acetylglucosamine--N-acetylmuramyl-(pentapeptide) pyrophosphoryl-undecaprenol N-acetylglucosamine transferase [Paraliobacillus sp. PM-2]|uniref:PssE/Cps14G family polysaccharide biosynthesis glycosyltransferase n=1 Tax=Paraliobacillus sp. PM-2 TaxID=1462524 RepID=UPI00061BE58C|nr:PssE/Cps14G family polysaccharide biosynthesis glycosyltransferase [Paraliobacillus sp. PM-2]CQR46193.1 UDP-N-acetylglucosamine--N-acetylmuramyl-(pentapeptide) pyrophosphoryl-undecaprenol N-acetylglucosamine transferase [Paraliobacillus sp. PM-2]